LIPPFLKGAGGFRLFPLEFYPALTGKGVRGISIYFGLCASYFVMGDMGIMGVMGKDSTPEYAGR